MPRKTNLPVGRSSNPDGVSKTVSPHSEISAMASVLSDDRFHSEEAAFEYVESQLWPDGPVCPHCGATADHIGRLTGVRSKPSKRNPEGVVQVGLRKCYACRQPFTVRKGSIFEDSHLPLRMW